jgi:hypothetical protein
MYRQPDPSRRDVVTKLVYVVPTVLSLRAVPAFARTGSGGGGGGGGQERFEQQPPTHQR